MSDYIYTTSTSGLLEQVVTITVTDNGYLSSPYCYLSPYSLPSNTIDNKLHINVKKHKLILNFNN